MNIIIDDLTDPQVRQLLSEHLDDMNAISPPESVHALDLQSLQQSDITFWTIWSSDKLAGCVALKEHDQCYGELKSMRTSADFKKRGVASTLLNHLILEGRSRGYKEINLETGTMSYFTPAHNLYRKYGFSECGPFANYPLDPNSTFFSLPL